MTTLNKLYNQIALENKRIDMIKNTKGLDVDFIRNTIKDSKQKIIKLQKEFDKEYINQNS
jgi:hypothetical protein